MNLTSWTFDQQQLEDHQDMVKVAVLQALVAEGIVTEAVAESWSAIHTVKLAEKTLWRTLSDRFKKAEKNTVLVVFKQVV
jgi:hypothetical protein